MTPITGFSCYPLSAFLCSNVRFFGGIFYYVFWAALEFLACKLFLADSCVNLHTDSWARINPECIIKSKPFVLQCNHLADLISTNTICTDKRKLRKCTCAHNFLF